MSSNYSFTFNVNAQDINAEGSFTFTVNLNPSALQTTADALSTEDVTFIIASVPPVASASVPATTFEFHLRCIEDDPTSDDDRNSSDNDNILVGDNIFGSNYSTTVRSITDCTRLYHLLSAYYP